MEWMIMPLKRYADFSGRSRRKEFWMFTLLLIIINLMVTSAFALVGGSASLLSDTAGLVVFAGGGFIYLVIFCALFLIPGLAVTVRRLHDQDKSGWFILIGVIPYIGGLILLGMMCLPGTTGPNRYGPDPKADEVLA